MKIQSKVWKYFETYTLIQILHEKCGRLTIMVNIWLILRSSHRVCSMKKVSLINLKHSQENTFVGVSFLIKLEAFIKKELRHKCSLVNFAKCLGTPFSQNNSGELLLHFVFMFRLTWTFHSIKNAIFHKGFLQYMWPNPQCPADLFTFTEEIVNGKLHFCV